MFQKRSPALGVPLMLMSALCFVVTGIAAKALYELAWSPGGVALVRATGASLLLIVPMVIVLRGYWVEVRRSWRPIVTYGAVSIAGSQILYFLALQHLSVAIAIMLVMLGPPILIVLLTWVRTKHRPSWLTLFGVAVAVVGLMLVLDLRGVNLNLMGVLLALAAAACLTYYFFVSSSRSIALPSIGFIGLGMCAGAAVTGLLVLTPILPVELGAGTVDVGRATVSWIVPVAVIVLFTIGAFVFGLLGLRYLGATVGSFVNLSEVPMSVLLGWLLLGEALGFVQLLGAAVVMTGVACVKWGSRTSP